MMQTLQFWTLIVGLCEGKNNCQSRWRVSAHSKCAHARIALAISKTNLISFLYDLLVVTGVIYCRSRCVFSEGTLIALSVLKSCR